MANVSGTNTVSTQNQQTSTGLPTNVQLALSQALNFNPSNGTALDQVDLKYTKTLSLAAAATTLDLTALTDVFGGTVNFARVKSITVKNKSTTDGQTVTIGGGAANPFTSLFPGTSTLIIGPSTANNHGVLVLWSPNTTGLAVSGTNKTIKLDPGANTISVDVEIMGCSA